MLTRSASYQHGYTIIEALIATAITSIITTGLWQLTLSARTLTERNFKEAVPICDLPQCDGIATGLKCICGERHFFIIR
jgi:hypothetical protein